LLINEEDIKAFHNNQEQYICIIYNDLKIEEAVEFLKQFIEEKNPEKNIKVYVFSNGQYPYTGDFEAVIERVELCALPDAIYKAYKHVIPVKNKMFKIEEEIEQNKNEEPDLFNQ
jgi:adenine-specific DNA-methyltransferase